MHVATEPDAETSGEVRRALLIKNIPKVGEQEANTSVTSGKARRIPTPELACPGPGLPEAHGPRPVSQGQRASRAAKAERTGVDMTEV